MPRYFFDVVTGDEAINRDLTGLEIPDVVAAEIEALETLKVLRGAGPDLFGRGGAVPAWDVAVLDPQGGEIARVSVKDGAPFG